MLAKIGIGILLVIVVLVVAIVTRPSSFHVARSATIAAPASIVFAQLDDFRRWRGWSPFEAGNPERTYSGTPAGQGSVYHYAGRKNGEGRLTMTDVVPNERVVVKAEFLKPFRATNRIELSLRPAAEGVVVTWAMSGRQTFTGKAISLFLNMDRVLGGEFEKGLDGLKRVSEQESAALGSSPSVPERTVSGAT